jgi:protein involved in polysaccharide export with SLBB domain
VYVTGFANQPGAFTVNSLSTMVNAVIAAGGPSAGGSFRSIKLYRNGSEVRDFDLYDLLRRGDRSTDAILQNEDVIFISPVGNQVAVVGSVNEEAIYEAKPGESVNDIVRIAGGPTELADSSRVILYALDDKGTVGSREVALGDISGKLAAAGDIIQVLSQGSLFHPLERQSVVVRLEGEVNKPGNYFVPANTPLSQVVEQAGGLTSRAYVYGTRVTRVTVREQQRASYSEAINQLESMLAAAPLSADQSISAGDREVQMRAARELLNQMRANEPDGRLVLDLPYAATNLPGDLVLENNDRIVVPPRIDTVGVFGSVFRPASFRLGDGKARVRDYVERSGGTTRFADKRQIFLVRANGEVVSRKRGALSAEVRPGDVVFVPVKAQSVSTWAKIKDIVQVVFQLGLGAATVAAIN